MISTYVGQLYICRMFFYFSTTKPTFRSSRTAVYKLGTQWKMHPNNSHRCWKLKINIFRIARTRYWYSCMYLLVSVPTKKHMLIADKWYLPLKEFSCGLLKSALENHIRHFNLIKHMYLCSMYMYIMDYFAAIVIVPTYICTYVQVWST
jgi:hypothetical protein